MITYLVGEYLKKSQGECEKSSLRRMCLYSADEFEGLVSDIPHKKTLMHFLSQTEYTKVQFFGSCIVGAVFIPDRERINDGGMHLGFHISENVLYIIGSECGSMPAASTMRFWLRVILWSGIWPSITPPAPCIWWPMTM